MKRNLDHNCLDSLRVALVKKSRFLWVAATKHANVPAGLARDSPADSWQLPTAVASDTSFFGMHFIRERTF
jgi:hypothetical protein